jgi:hypothetical protein
MGRKEHSRNGPLQHYLTGAPWSGWRELPLEGREGPVATIAPDDERVGRDSLVADPSFGALTERHQPT